MKKLLARTSASLVALAAASAFSAPPKEAVTDGVVKIGVLTDMSGVYSALGGKGTQVAVEMAIKDFGGSVLGKPIQVVGADHQNKADIASAKAREWFDTEKVDMITGLLNTGCALAVQKLGGDKKRVVMVTGAASTDLTNSACTPYSVHYVYDTYALGKVTGQAVVQGGGKNWFFITADYAFGQSLEANTTKFVVKGGGKAVGSVRHPLSTADFSSYLLQAQNSGAQIIGLANAGADTINAIKQAREFGIGQKGQKLVGLLIFDTDIKALGLNVAQGMQFTSGFYWDRDNGTREFSKRFFAIHKAMPTMDQAGAYSATMNYLKAIKAAGTDDPDAVMAKLKSMNIADFFAVNGKIRADGRMVHDMYLMEVKKPAESKGEWDLLKIVKTVPGDEAYQPLSESTCPLVKK
ncbi:MAG: ABC transporter substrate-binding protein [Acidobacteria bacterium]|nr:ABC transporter substrate-binding protein [Acidobacteriota bacterium]